MSSCVSPLKTALNVLTVGSMKELSVLGQELKSVVAIACLRVRTLLCSGLRYFAKALVWGWFVLGDELEGSQESMGDGWVDSLLVVSLLPGSLLMDGEVPWSASMGVASMAVIMLVYGVLVVWYDCRYQRVLRCCK